jgi:hypothetical protein
VSAGTLIVFCVAVLPFLSCAKKSANLSSAPEAPTSASDAARESGMPGMGGGQMSVAKTASGSTSYAAAAAASRKLVRTGSVSLLCENAEQAAVKLQQIASSLGGFVGASSLSRVSDGSQSGSMTIRVPTPRFEDALSKIRELGKVEQITTGVDDVTGQFVDLEARIRNAKREEQEILKLFDRGGKLSDVITVESKLAEVRGQIETYDAQLRALREQTDLSTITVSLYEKGKASVPEPGEYSANYHLRSAWRALLGILRGLLTFVIYVVVVGWVVWLPILLIVWAARSRRRKGPGGG